MNRTELLDRLQSHAEPWDLLVIGGGATGVGCVRERRRVSGNR